MGKRKHALHQALGLIAMTQLGLGCAHHRAEISNMGQPENGALVVDLDATRRTAIVIHHTQMCLVDGESEPIPNCTPVDRMWACPEAPPDVAVAIERTIAAAAEIEGYGAADVTATLQETLRAIQPTTEYTTILRSVLSVSCFLAGNAGATPEEATSMTTRLLELALRDVPRPPGQLASTEIASIPRAPQVTRGGAAPESASP